MHHERCVGWSMYLILRTIADKNISDRYRRVSATDKAIYYYDMAGPSR